MNIYSFNQLSFSLRSLYKHKYLPQPQLVFETLSLFAESSFIKTPTHLHDLRPKGTEISFPWRICTSCGKLSGSSCGSSGYHPIRSILWSNSNYAGTQRVNSIFLINVKISLLWWANFLILLKFSSIVELYGAEIIHFYYKKKSLLRMDLVISTMTQSIDIGIKNLQYANTYIENILKYRDEMILPSP